MPTFLLHDLVSEPVQVTVSFPCSLETHIVECNTTDVLSSPFVLFSMMSELQVEKWNTETDGPLNEASMRRKLKSQGYSCIKYTFPPGTDFPDHTHNVSKKDSIIAGQFRFAMKGREVILQPGDMIEVPAGVVHNASVIGSESVVFFDATK